MKIYLNGKLVPEREAKVSVFDHGLLYGDGVFEGIRSYNGRVFMLDEHVERLFRSAKAIDLKIPLSPAQMARAVVRTCRENRVLNGYIRLVVTRGVGTLGLNPYTCAKPQVIIIAGTIQLYPKKLYDEGLSIVTVGTIRNHTESINPQIKSLNYLNNVLAKIEAQQAGAGEGLMLNEQGYVAECTGDNIFTVKNGALFTPPISSGALAGVTRAAVFEMASELGIAITEPEMTRYDIYTADECFLTGTAAEVIPVVRLDSRTIGDGLPGPVTKRLIARYRELTASSGTAIY